MSSALVMDEGWMEHGEGDMGIGLLSPMQPSSADMWWLHDMPNMCDTPDVPDMEPISLPAAAGVPEHEEPAKERCISITKRKRKRVQEKSPCSPTPSDASHTSSSTSSSRRSNKSSSCVIVQSLDACSAVLERMRSEKWCRMHCSSELQLCDESEVRPGSLMYIFK
jgi:hypothetical protein